MKYVDNYTIQDVTEAMKIQYLNCIEGKFPTNKPKAYILGGQGGAGKTTLQNMFVEKDNNTICINGDEYRKYHPNYKIIQEKYGMEAANYTQSFANNVANALVEKLSNDGYNIVIEGTCRRTEVPLKTCNDLKEKGYIVELSVMCTDKDVAWQSAIDRYNMMKAQGQIPRAVPRDKYEATVNALPGNLEELYHSRVFNEITLYNRNRECLYRKTQPPYDRYGDMVFNPRDVLYQELHLRDNVLNKPIAVTYFSEITEKDEVKEFETFNKFAHWLMLPDPTSVKMCYETECVATQAINNGYNPWDVFHQLKNDKKGYQYDDYGHEYIELYDGQKAQEIYKTLYSKPLTEIEVLDLTESAGVSR